MGQEVKPLLRAVGAWSSGTCGGFPTREVRIHARGCILIQCGIGERNAEHATRALLEACSPRALVSFGVSGSVTPEAGVGDVVTGRAVWRLDNGRLTGRRPLARWPAQSLRGAAAALADRGAKLLDAEVVTTRGEQAALPGAHDIACPVLDMETAGVVMAASAAGVPLYSIRAISDSPREPLPFEISHALRNA